MPKKMNYDMTHEEALRLFVYEPDTGLLRARHDTHKGRWPAGRPVGSKNGSGYLVVWIGTDDERRGFRVHRLAWLIHYGEWPPHEVDHINGDRMDNRISNLRSATPSQNLSNQPSRRNGLKGAYTTPEGRWRALVGRGAAFKHLGTFDTEKEAHDAYCIEATKRYGEFARFD